MNKYERLKNDLEVNGIGMMKGFGNSMLPILKSGSLLTYIKSENYQIGDIVFCKVKGRYIDAHKIVKTDINKGFLIANNHGYENGWTKIIFGKVIQAEFQKKVIYEKINHPNAKSDLNKPDFQAKSQHFHLMDYPKSES